MAAFNTPLDIANRALQRLGIPRITSFSASSREAQEIAFAYNKLRVAELERNLWRFSTRRTVLRSLGIDSSLWTPPAWASGTSYAAGAVVSYTPTSGVYNGVTDYWQLLIAESDSTTTPDQDPNWDHYTGPVAIDLYNTGNDGTGSISASSLDGQTYQAGEVVLVPATYASGTSYSINNVVAYENNNVWEWYVSLVNSNEGNTPSSSPTEWALWTSVGRANGVYGQTATDSPIPLTYPGAVGVYISLYNQNADNPAAGTSNWLSVGGTIAPLQIVWPLGSGPSYQVQTKNCFYLPNDFLKRAPSDPKGGMFGYLGANSGSRPDDWVEEGNLIVTGDAGPIMLRFIANLTDVTKMTSLFCEGLSARLAQELCEALYQDLAKKQQAMQAYSICMSDARSTNAIEIGPITRPESRYITVRA